MKTLVAQKPMYEKVLPNIGASWRYVIYDLTKLEFNWHYHPEYEIALTLGSSGYRYIGDCIERYDECDLALLGPNLPHTWSSDSERDGEAFRVYVAQIPAPWLDSIVDLPELSALRALLDKSRRGVSFSAGTTRRIAHILVHQEDADPLRRMFALIRILQLMSEDNAARMLCSSGYTFSAHRDSGLDRIEKVIHYIHTHFTEDLHAEQMARHAHMSVSHFHRFIKQRTEQTFNELLTQLRIGKACSMLISTRLPVNTISSLCGFNNLANFNRRFLQHKHLTPSAYRLAYCQGSPLARS